MNKNKSKSFNKILLFKQYFDMFKKKNDINNMFMILYEMRITQGKMSTRLYNRYSLLQKKNKQAKENDRVSDRLLLNKQYYNVSIYESVVDVAKDIIRECEKSLQSYMSSNYKIDLNEYPTFDGVAIGVKNPFMDSSLQNILNMQPSPVGFATQLSNKFDVIDFLRKVKYGDQINMSGGDNGSNTKMKYKHPEALNPTILLFYSSGCPHCVNFMPVWSELVESLKGNEVQTYKIEGTQYPELTDKFKINGYPTILYMKNGIITEYTGKRTKDSILKFINQTNE